jgi:hypothetical protein
MKRNGGRVALLACLLAGLSGCGGQADTSATPDAVTSPPAPTASMSSVVATPAQTPGLTALPVTPAPSATSSPTARPSATPQGSPLGPRRAISTFISAFAWSPPPFRVRCSIYVDYLPGPIVSYDPQGGSILIDGDTNGYDFAGWYASQGETTDVIYVDGVGYIRTPPADWDRPVGFELAIYPNPFFWLEEPDVTHLGVVSRVGRRLHHMSADWFAGLDPAEWMTDADWLGPEFGWTDMHDIEIESTRFEFYVRDDGMPTEAVLELKLRGTAGEEEARLVFTYTYIFTKHGEEVTIEAPDLRDAA